MRFAKEATDQIDKPDYAKRAYTEALANALICSDYIVMGSGIKKADFFALYLFRIDNMVRSMGLVFAHCSRLLAHSASPLGVQKPGAAKRFTGSFCFALQVPLNKQYQIQSRMPATSCVVFGAVDGT